MTENEAKAMLEAKLTCMELEDLACVGNGCDRNCDDCKYHYGQGTRGEAKESLNIAIQALEENQQYHAIGTVEEFKALKEKAERFDRNIKMFNEIGLEIRNKVIDEFAERIKEKIESKYCRANLTSQYVGMQTCIWVNEIAEQMKVGNE